MTQQNEQTADCLKVMVSVIVLAAVLIAAGCKKKSAEVPNTGHQQEGQTPSTLVGENSGEGSGSPGDVNDAVGKTDTGPGATTKPSLGDVIRRARSWGPVYMSWYGRMAPDFTLTDITGERHKLSDYRGKDVMLVFWATWCRYCIIEIPHLIELQKRLGKDNLAILGISYISPINTTGMVKSFIERNKIINYPVFSTYENVLPAPFNSVQYLPSSFFVNREGKIKLATTGPISLMEMEAILQAE